MNMFSNHANYDMDEALQQAGDKKLLLDVKAETQVVLQLLVKKGIVTREEVSEMREMVKNSKNYRAAYEYLDNTINKANYYKENPEEHLRDLMKAKMNGDIK